MFCYLAIPFKSSRVLLWNASAKLKLGAKHEIGNGVSLCGGLLVPFDCFTVVFYNASPALNAPTR